MAALLGIVFPVTFTGHGQLPAKLNSRRRLVVKSSNSSDERQILFNRIAPVYDNVWINPIVSSFISFFSYLLPLNFFFNSLYNYVAEWSLKLRTTSYLEEHVCFLERVSLRALDKIQSLSYVLRIFVLMLGLVFIEVRARTGDKVLDLCCGSGDLAFLLSEKVGPSGKVWVLVLGLVLFWSVACLFISFWVWFI